jgi:glutamate--cysteine ligase
MTDQLIRNVSALFPRRHGRRTLGVGIEQELLTRDAVDGRPVRIDRVRRAIAGSSYEQWTGFEPGGQVELSLPCFPSVAALGHAWPRIIRELREDSARVGVLLDADPVDTRSPDEVPLQLESPRYLGMQRHFDRIGPAGRRMMRRTASTQVCLDWWPGRDGWEQWRLAQLAGPFLAAVLARSSGSGSRLSTWLAVDPSRTAFDDRLLHAGDPVRAYAAFAAGACVFGMPGSLEPDQPTPFAKWAATGRAGAADVAHHLSTLFPPVRPRGRYLEVRFLDAQPDDLVVPTTALLSRLLHDDDARVRALRVVSDAEGQLADLWKLAAESPHELVDRGVALVQLAGGLASDRESREMAATP